MSHGAPTQPAIYGLMAEYADGDALLAAVVSAREQGYQAMDAYSHVPIHGLYEAMGAKPTKLALIVLVAGLCAGTTALVGQFIGNAVHYPIIIGGRPMASFPSYIPVTYNSLTLTAFLTTAIVMFALNGFPAPYHPVFNVKRFERASTDGYFFCIESKDPLFDPVKTKAFLESSKPTGIFEVPW